VPCYEFNLFHKNVLATIAILSAPSN